MSFFLRPAKFACFQLLLNIPRSSLLSEEMQLYGFSPLVLIGILIRILCQLILPCHQSCCNFNPCETTYCTCPTFPPWNLFHLFIMLSCLRPRNSSGTGETKFIFQKQKLCWIERLMKMMRDQSLVKCANGLLNARWWPNYLNI